MASEYLLFDNLVEIVNNIFSFIYNFSLARYDVVLNFLFHNVDFVFTTFQGEIVTFSALPDIEIISDIAETIFRLLFDPIFGIGSNTIYEVPFAMCLISFVIKGSLIILLVKMIKLGIITS